MLSYCRKKALVVFFNKFAQRSISTTKLRHQHDAQLQNDPLDTTKRVLPDGPKLADFLTGEQEIETAAEPVPYLDAAQQYGQQRKVYFDVYGCQMNFNDTEIVWAILKGNNFQKTEDVNEALLVTCAIRENAENKIWHRIKHLNAVRRKRGKGSPMKIGLLGCMAERLKHKIIEKEKAVDLIAGPDSYKDLPRLLALTENNQTAVNVLLSLDETYADVMPVRLNEDSVTGFVSIMRGCDNMCTYCIVPFTRGRERSRPVSSILREVEELSKQGIKEITLLGQNVNSYRDISESADAYTVDNEKPTAMPRGFKTVYKTKIGGLRFADLLDKVAEVNPEMRIRFTSPHPKDFPDEVLEVIKSRANVCKSLHMPAQSGNTAVLERMRRGYSREAYLELVEHIRQFLPGVSLSSDFICGFCDETEEEFEDTLSLMETVKYNVAYLFAYSMREKTTAHRRYKDNIPQHVKLERLQRMSNVFRKHADILHKSQIGQMQLILIEGDSKKSNEQVAGRNDGNLKVVVPKKEIPCKNNLGLRAMKPGDYVVVKVTDATSQGLRGTPLYHTTLREYVSWKSNPYQTLSVDYLKYNSMM